MKNRRTFLCGLTLGTLCAPLAAKAQRPVGKVPRIGVLESWSPSAFPHRLAALQQGLLELGYVEGQSILVESRWAHGRVAELPGLAAELVRLKVDVIFAGTTPGRLSLLHTH